MAHTNIYRGKYGGTKVSFLNSELDTDTGTWGSPTNQSGVEYLLKRFAEYKNPITGETGYVSVIDVPLQGINLVNDVGDEFCMLENYAYQLDDQQTHGWGTGTTAIASIPSDWDYAFTSYWTVGNYQIVANTPTQYYLIQQVTPTTSGTAPGFPTGNVVRFPAGVTHEAFYTDGQGYFGVKHIWKLSSSSFTEQASPFWTRTDSYDQYASKRYSYDFYTFGGANGQIPQMDSPYRTSDFEYAAGSTGYLNQTAMNKEPRLKFKFVSYHLPEGITATTSTTSTPQVSKSANFNGVGVFEYSEDGFLQRVRIVGITLDFWNQEGQSGYWGEDAGVAGGDGIFKDPSDNKGGKDGKEKEDDAATRNQGANGFLGAAGAYGYTLWSGVSIPTLCGELFFPSKNEEGVSAFINMYAQSLYNPLSAIIGAHMITTSFTVAGGNPTNITAAGYKFATTAVPHETATIAHFHMPKAFDFPNYFGAFPDFAPYTTCKLYLPYIGFVDIDINLVQYGWLSVDYLCDMMNGNVTAFVYCSDKDGHTWDAYIGTGNCAFNVPIYTNSQDGSGLGKIVTGVGAAVGAASLVAAAPVGLPLIAASGVATGTGLALSAGQTLAQKPNVVGSFGAGNSRITELDCFLLIQRPQWANPAASDEIVGVPSMISGCIDLSSDGIPFTGFLKCQQVDLKGVTCTDEEKEYIERVMKTGMYV